MQLIQVERVDGIAVIVPTMRRLDAGVAPAFKQEVVAVVQGGERRLLVDLAKVEFVDSSGLGALVSVLKALGGQGSLALSGAQGNVMSLFKLTRMDRVFAIEADRAKGLQRLGGG